MVALEGRPIGVDQEGAQPEKGEERIKPPCIAAGRFSETATL